MAFKQFIYIKSFFKNHFIVIFLTILLQKTTYILST